jgi:hypothetical protein
MVIGKLACEHLDLEAVVLQSSMTGLRASHVKIINVAFDKLTSFEAGCTN